MSPASEPLRNWPRVGGELAALIREFDWTTTPLGPASHWPQSLRTATELLLLSPVPIVMLWGEDGIMIYNDAYSSFAGERHPQLLGSKVREGWPEVADFNDNVMKVGLSGGTLAYREHELTLKRHGEPAPAWMNLDYSPVLDESGRPAGVIAIVVEITDQVLAQRQLRESESRFRALVNASSDVIYRLSADWTEMRALDGRGFLTNTDEPTVRWLDEYLLPEDQAEVIAAGQRAIDARAPFELEHRVRQADGSIGWTQSRAIPIFDDAGEILEWFGMATDVTERRRTDEHLRLMVNELNHRVKNTLSMVQAIAMQTFRQSGEDEAIARFSARLVALAKANDLLTGEQWISVDLSEVLARAVGPHMDDPARLSLSGPKVEISAKSALAMTLAMHELATNAAKYGAWSDDKGKVTIAWRLDESGDAARLVLEWRESDGPTVAPPQRRGFGSRLIERGLAAELNGSVAMTFGTDGLTCRIDAPHHRTR